MARPKKATVRDLSDIALVERVYSMFVNTAQGRRSVADDSQYPQLRREMIRRKLELPGLVETHTTLDSYAASIRSTKNRVVREERVNDEFARILEHVREGSESFEHLAATSRAPRPLDPDDAPLLEPQAGSFGPLAGEARAVVGPPGVTGFEARIVKSSSAWTGRRSVAEQVTIIKAFAPLAQTAAVQVEQAVREKRFNDPETAEALEALRDLHHAIGELIQAAEHGGSLSNLWDRVEENKERVFTAVAGGAKLMIAAPVLAIGMAQVLCWLSGAPVSGEMLATLCGGTIIGDSLKQRRNAERSNPAR